MYSNTIQLHRATIYRRFIKEHVQETDILTWDVTNYSMRSHGMTPTKKSSLIWTCLIQKLHLIMWKILIKYSKTTYSNQEYSFLPYLQAPAQLQLLNTECHRFIEFWNLIGGNTHLCNYQSLSRTVWEDKKRIVPEYSPHM